MTQIRAETGYPSHRVADVALRDGSTMRIRPVKQEDADDLFDLFTRVSDESTRFRFHAVAPANPGK